MTRPDLYRVAVDAMKRGLRIGGWSQKQARDFLKAAIRLKFALPGPKGRARLATFERLIRELELHEQRAQVNGAKALTIWPESADRALNWYRELLGDAS